LAGNRNFDVLATRGMDMQKLPGLELPNIIMGGHVPFFAGIWRSMTS
jgi:hypothetical protein